MQLFKIVGPSGECQNGGSGDWPLPTDTEPGAWREVEGPLEACRNGLHLTDAEHIAAWSHPGAVLYRAEVDGELIPTDGKYVARRVRLLPRRKPARILAPDALARAEDRRTRAIARADNAARHRIDALPQPPASGYLSAVNARKLPAGHPLAGQVAALDAYHAAAAVIMARRQAAVDKASATYRRTVTSALDPAYA